ncbi:glucose-6-phosphate isomerase, partial ['Chrysanthemum coronarium' phytoplasma]
FKLNLEGIYNFLDWHNYAQTFAPQIKVIHQKLHQDQHLKEKYLGWL